MLDVFLPWETGGTQNQHDQISDTICLVLDSPAFKSMRLALVFFFAKRTPVASVVEMDRNISHVVTHFKDSPKKKAATSIIAVPNGEQLHVYPLRNLHGNMTAADTIPNFEKNNL